MTKYSLVIIVSLSAVSASQMGAEVTTPPTSEGEGNTAEPVRPGSWSQYLSPIGLQQNFP